MLKKRIVGVITVRDGWAVQSFGYRRYLPVGRPDVLAENLDRWGADEILVQSIDRSRQGLGPDYAVLERIASRGLGTPIIVAGGIRNVQDALRCVNGGADRVCVDALLHDAPESVADIAAQLGAQAVVAALPLAVEASGLAWLDYRSGRQQPLGATVLSLLKERIVSEALVIDWKNEGSTAGFTSSLLASPELGGIPLIAFGGIGNAQLLREVLALSQTVAAGIGNALNYREHSVRLLKRELGLVAVRETTLQQGDAKA